MPNFYEFFAGGGMARAGLGEDWSCLFANDFDHKKGRVYAENWGGDALQVGDIKAITLSQLPKTPDLVWASFPCQDLSLAGGGAGLKGNRSGTYWPFWNLLTSLVNDRRAPRIIALENVCGTLTSHKGKDFAAIARSFEALGYRFGALVVNAQSFLPQSRPRLFMIGAHQNLDIPQHLQGFGPCIPWHTRTLGESYERLPAKARKNWIWWQLPEAPMRNMGFSNLVEDNPTSVSWHTAAETRKLIKMMSPVNFAKLKTAKKLKQRIVGTVYKRTRRDEDGNKIQRAEVRFDDIAGCLRTPAGGSSRQVIMVVDGNRVRTRLISSRETARLMGLPDEYILPENYNQAYHLTGDGVAVPVVRHLAKHIFEPVMNARLQKARKAA